MHRVTAGDHAALMTAGCVEVALARLGRSDADRLIGQPHGQGVAVRLAVRDDRGQAKVAARAQDAHGDLATIRDEDLADHD